MIANPFRVDILDSSGNKLADGPLRNIEQLNTTESLDKVGSATFSMPISDPRTQYITESAQFDLYDEQDGYLGRYLYEDRDTDYANQKLTVKLFDALRELSRRTVAFRRGYHYEWVDVVIDDLVDIMGDWSTSVDAEIGHTTVNYEGESVLMAVDELRDRWGQHYRLDNSDPLTKILEFGAFGSDSGVRATNLIGQVQTDIGARPEIAIITAMNLKSTAAEIFNRIIPLGGGQGTVQVTIEQASGGEYTTQTGTNADGSSYYYIEDTDSIATYGLREKVLSFPSIRPLDNNDENIRNAANALKGAAEVYMRRHLAPVVEYGISIDALRQPLRVGDTVRVIYRGEVEGYGYADIDQNLYVMDISRQRSASGQRSVKLAVATIAQRRTADTDVLIGVVHDLQALKVHVQPSLTLVKSNGKLRMDDTNDAQFTIRIKSEVLALNRALLRFKTGPLLSSVQSVASGGGTTATSASGGGTTATSTGGGVHDHDLFGNNASGPPGGTTYVKQDCLVVIEDQYGTDHSEWMQLDVDNSYTQGVIKTFAASDSHDHDVTVPAHTHDVTVPNHNHAMSYGLYEDSDTPDTVRLAINGVDVTTALGGPWAVGGGVVEQEIDIATYLINATGGLRQNHRITFSCDDGQGEIEFETDMMLTIQAIQVT